MRTGRTNRHRNVIKKCPHCRAEYVLGEHGIKGTCDRCAGIKRDKKGYAWHPGENIKIMCKVEDWPNVYVVTREEAFG